MTDQMFGAQTPHVPSSQFNTQRFVMQMLLSRIATAKLVQVMACTNTDDVEAPGTVDVLPLVNMVDGKGQPVQHQTAYKLPYFRLQGGANAVIIDPEPGDIGVAVFCDRDTSSAITNQGQANPGSSRQYDMADGLYLGGFINQVPTQFLQFNDADGITITSPRALTIDAETTLNGSIRVTGNVSVGTGATGTFTTSVGQVVTVTDGIITNIY